MALSFSVFVVDSGSCYLEVFLQESKLILDSQRERDWASEGLASPIDYGVQ